MVPDQDLAAFQYLVFSAGDLRVGRGDAAGSNWQSGLAGARFLLRTGDCSGRQVTSKTGNPILRETADFDLTLDYRGRFLRAAA